VRGTPPRVYPGCERCNTAGYTSGWERCNTAGYTSLSLFPFHCWARSVPLPCSRFTVGLETGEKAQETRYRERLCTRRGEPSTPVSLLGEEQTRALPTPVSLLGEYTRLLGLVPDKLQHS